MPALVYCHDRDPAERTKVPLRTWLLVAWHLVQTKIVVSALSVEQIAGINYSTAWSLLHKMRAAVDQDGRDRRSGDLELTRPMWEAKRKEYSEGPEVDPGSAAARRVDLVGVTRQVVGTGCWLTQYLPFPSARRQAPPLQGR